MSVAFPSRQRFLFRGRLWRFSVASLCLLLFVAAAALALSWSRTGRVNFALLSTWVKTPGFVEKAMSRLKSAGDGFENEHAAPIVPAEPSATSPVKSPPGIDRRLEQSSGRAVICPRPIRTGSSPTTIVRSSGRSSRRRYPA